ncbi:hypothetical protein CS542_02220 [Pedobacter sp. IW39]|nr:hypothetical protein CS542_02220 [Pedobacter sp. IW39]
MLVWHLNDIKITEIMADRLFGITDTGRVRANNEDEFITQEVRENKFMIAGVVMAWVVCRW